MNQKGCQQVKKLRTTVLVGVTYFFAKINLIDSELGQTNNFNIGVTITC